MSAPTKGPYKACRELTQEWVEDANGDVIADVYEDLHLLAASWEMREAITEHLDDLDNGRPINTVRLYATLAKAQGEGR